ncbi:hypothetical protein O3G_MSEX011300 [Manduca sexta]|uniref:Olfactory receptor 39 n=1 Tax=Manduca sexta TaxID=7130 RepID=A0A5K8B0Y9_MANSE|nr:hypothetical protein O3G_MSEX011300 [Manduca sexta]CUQ99288.1 TPA: Olfactory receptor 39 [Manduca sexta]
MEGTIRTFHRILSLLGISIFAKEEWNSKKWLALQIFTFINGFITSILTSIFVIANVSDLFLFIQGACIWTTSVIMSISLGVCLLFRKAFRNFLDEMVFEDAVLEIPLIKLVVMAEGGEKMAELKTLVLESQEKLLKYTKILLKTYMAIVWLCAILYICTPVYLMITTDDKSLRLLGFDMWFPWSLDNFKVYIASFVFDAYGASLCCISYPGFQSTIILLVGQEKLSPDTTKYYVHEFCFIQVVLMFCLLGQHVENELEVAVLEKWHIFNKPHQTNVRIFHTAVSQRMPIYIFGTIPLSLPTFTWEKLSPDTTKYYVHEFCFIQVVLMFCLLGQHVENEKWHIFNKPHQTNVRIFHTAVSQRMPIYIFGTIPLSLPTFTWVS